MEPKFHFPKKAWLLNDKPHHEADKKPDTDGSAAAATASTGLMKAVCLDSEKMVLNE